MLSTVLPFCIPLAVLGLSIRVTLDDVRRALSNRLALLRVCLLSLIAVPLVAAGVCKLLAPDSLVQAIVLVAAIAPGDPFIVIEAEDKAGDVPLAVGLTVILTFVMPFSLFVWTPILNDIFAGHLHASAYGAFVKVVTLIMPFLIGGLLIRTFAPRLADAVTKPVGIVAKAAYAFVGVIAIVAGFKYILHYSFATASAIVIITAIALLLGYFFGGYKRERAKRTAALTVALGNLVVVLFIGLDTYHYPVDKFAGAAFTAVVVRVLAVMAFNLLAKRSKQLALAETA